ncbi:HupE/UreJ family protein [Allomesorhizobium camelthorni]|uniref:HupE/UreJ family protein n=1 Tax=Allomesorhizobium camelthorni TaxID=475069 RepID=A0A6G4WMA9_9HYPH|nr:HupE/UreJ family protein [Mesorhizobium camelthorni]NGO55498.1 HupE/UreJ family protein [Mesorhizobium camelthorni]
MMKRIAIVPAALGASVAPAFAHLDPTEHGSLMAGLSHPLFGSDHVLAMVAVGLWAALLGGRALWLAPLAFVGAMSTGFAAALMGAPLPFVEPVILASIVVIGLLAATALHVPAAIAAAMVGFFAFFHGHAHGGELGSAGAIAFGVGFALSTVLLHMTGIGLAHLFGGGAGRLAARVAAGAAALGGLWLVMAG